MYLNKNFQERSLAEDKKKPLQDNVKERKLWLATDAVNPIEDGLKKKKKKSLTFFSHNMAN